MVGQAPALVHAVQPSATPAVAVAGIVVVAAIICVLLVSFLFYRRSGRR